MPNGPNVLERLQREYTVAYKGRLDKYRNARILFSIITRDGYILLVNPYWQDALGHDPAYLHFRSLFTLVPDSERERLLHAFALADTTEVNETVFHFGHKEGYAVTCLCWLSRWVEKSSGVYVATLTAVVCDE